jgi:hypothetical protein
MQHGITGREKNLYWNLFLILTDSQKSVFFKGTPNIFLANEKLVNPAGYKNPLILLSLFP